jgi:hypothetical protein
MTTFTIAGSYHEFFAFLGKKSLPRDTREYTFFSDPTHLRSLNDVEILCVGEYWKSPVYEYRYRNYQAQSKNIKFVNEHGAAV